MSTRALFRPDAYLQACSATLTRVDAQGIEFDQTVFYPTGGGQAGDCGVVRTAAGLEIVIADTRKSKRAGAAPEDVVHIPAPGQDALLAGLAPGTPVELEIDWARRYRHMRFHTATHLLCAIVGELVDGCSITAQHARLDIAMADVLDRDAVETALCALVEAAHPVSSRSITSAELFANPQLVKSMSVQPPLSSGTVRLIDIEGVDLQPCGGTHVRNTREIGAITVTKIEKKGARTRRVILGLDAQ